MEITWLKVPQWESYGDLLHGFIGRRGGRSVGNFAGLNLSLRVGDDQQTVKDNICDMKRAVGIHDGRIVTMKQVHGDDIIEVKNKSLKEAGQADATVTQQTGTYLGVLTADCVPILFVARKRKLVAAVHAGWRGTLQGITDKLIRLFSDRYGISAAELEAALGPSIGACCYEVKEDVTRPLIDKWGSLASASIEARDGKSFLDLRSLNRNILAQSGVPSAQIFEIGPCTSCAADDFFSYRRAGGETGRQLSFIGWLSGPL